MEISTELVQKAYDMRPSNTIYIVDGHNLGCERFNVPSRLINIKQINQLCEEIFCMYINDALTNHKRPRVIVFFDPIPCDDIKSFFGIELCFASPGIRADNMIEMFVHRENRRGVKKWNRAKKFLITDDYKLYSSMPLNVKRILCRSFIDKLIEGNRLLEDRTVKEKHLLQEEIQQKREQEEKQNSDVRDSFLEKIGSNDPKTRKQVVRGLRHFPAQETLEALLYILVFDVDFSVRKAAVNTILTDKFYEYCGARVLDKLISYQNKNLKGHPIEQYIELRIREFKESHHLS